MFKRLVVAFFVSRENQTEAKMLEDPDQDKLSGVKIIRESVKNHIRIARLKHRQDEVDNLRITLGELEDHAINLETYTKDVVLEIATKIKRQRNASPAELLKLCHAFLQSTENVSCFLSSTGSIQVIVKELTGKIRSVTVNYRTFNMINKNIHEIFFYRNKNRISIASCGMLV